MRKQKGLSTIVATLIIILLVLVAIGVIWVVVRNVIQEGTEQINLGKFTLDLDLKQVQVIDNDTISATVKRNAGAGEFVSLVFIIDDGLNSETVTINETLQELEQKTFTVDLQIINPSNIQKISLAPVFRLTSGKEVIGDVKDILNIGSGVSQCSDTCQSLGYECGTNTICGQSVNCGTCSGSYVCSGGTCVDNSSCTDTCQSLGYECGTHTICGIDTNCGDVNTSCVFPNAQPTCNAGQCELLSCNTNYGNCDGNETNGCEADLTTNATCGSCLVSCNVGALETCSGGSCVAPPPVCGDGSCNGDETCGDDDVAPACNTDCGTCAAVCGNNVQEGTEECDGTDLAGENCASQMGTGYTGNLDCYASGLPNECTFDTSGCVPPAGCGDSTCDAGECNTCPQDCTHADCCPDGTCNNGEQCGSDDTEPYCNSDCGACAGGEGDYIGAFTPDSANGNSHGIAQNGTFIWITDYADDEVYKYYMDGTYTGEHFDTNSNGHSSLWGIDAYGNYLYIVDHTLDVVAFYSMDGTYTGNYCDLGALGSTSAYGVTVDGTFIWTTDVTTDTIYKFYINGTYTQDYFDSYGGNGNPSGITSDGNFFWTTDYYTDYMYKYSMDGTYTGTAYNLSTMGSTYSEGIENNGTFFWFVDAGSNQVFILDGPD